MSEVTFEMFMGTVNRILINKVGLGADELADVAYFDMYDDGLSPAEAAVEALYENDAPQELIDLIEVGL